MPRRAEWRSLPDEPKGGVGLLRVWVRDVGSLPGADAIAGWAIGLGGASGYFLLLGLLAARSTRLFLGEMLIQECLSVVGLATLKLTAKRRQRRPERPPPLPHRFEDLLPLPLSEGTFPVHLAVRYRGILTALDVAAATFVDGWLHVEGRRASFALRAGDAHTEWRRGTTLRVTFPDDQAIDLWVADGLKLEPYFRHAATLWIADRDYPEGESILPPLGVQPSIRAGRLASALLGAIVPVGLGGFLASMPREPPWASSR